MGWVVSAPAVGVDLGDVKEQLHEHGTTTTAAPGADV